SVLRDRAGQAVETAAHRVPLAAVPPRNAVERTFARLSDEVAGGDQVVARKAHDLRARRAAQRLPGVAIPARGSRDPLPLGRIAGEANDAGHDEIALIHD